MSRGIVGQYVALAESITAWGMGAYDFDHELRSEVEGLVRDLGFNEDWSDPEIDRAFWAGEVLSALYWRLGRELNAYDSEGNPRLGTSGWKKLNEYQDRLHALRGFVSNARKSVSQESVVAEPIENIAPLIREAGAGIRPLVIMVENHMGETASLRSIRDQLGDVAIVHSSISYAGLLATAQEEEVVHSRRAIVLTDAGDMQPYKTPRKNEFSYPALEELRKRYPRRGLIIVGKVDKYTGKPSPTFPPMLKEKYGRYGSPRDEARFWLIAKSAGARLVMVRDSGWVGYSPNQLSSAIINRLERLGPGTPVHTLDGVRYYVGPATPRQVQRFGLAPGATESGMHLFVHLRGPGGAKRARLELAPQKAQRLTSGVEIWSEYDIG